MPNRFYTEAASENRCRPGSTSLRFYEEVVRGRLVYCRYSSAVWPLIDWPARKVIPLTRQHCESRSMRTRRRRRVSKRRVSSEYLPIRFDFTRLPMGIASLGCGRDSRIDCYVRILAKRENIMSLRTRTRVRAYYRAPLT